MSLVFFSAGEVSGDLSASEVIKILTNNGIKCVGVGGKHMEKAGMVNITNTDETLTSSVGFSESIKFILPKIKLMNFVTNYLKNEKPNAVVLVDNQGFNLPLAKKCKKLGIKTLYYFPPMVSVWGENAKYKVAKYCDKILCTFRSDYDIYSQVSENAVYVGNPLVDRIKNNYTSRKNYLKEFRKDSKKVLLLPGSRQQEVKQLLPIFLDTVSHIMKRQEKIELEFYIVVSHQAFIDKVKAEVSKRNLQNYIKIYLNSMDYALYDIADVVIASSGTVVLEMALLKKPTIVTYIVSPITYAIGRLLVKTRFISLPNIILREMVFPELLQSNVNPNLISDYILRFLLNSKVTNNLIGKLDNLKLEGGAALKVADEVQKLLEI